MELKGTIECISDELINGNFKRKNLVLVTHEQYPQYLTIEVSENNYSKVNNFRSGDLVTAFTNLKGVKYADKNTGEEKYFNKIVLWKIESFKEINNLDF